MSDFIFNTPEEREKGRKLDLQAMSKKVASFFWDVAPSHGLESRDGQQDMSFEIIDALIYRQHLAVEAGVGIGKSFGYLVPVLLYNKKMQKPVIVATSTIALQEQLWNDVHTVMPLLNLKPEVMIAKEQTHYLCHKRANAFLNSKGAEVPKELRDGIKQEYQERKRFPSSLLQNVWEKVNIQHFNTRNCSYCDKHRKCLYYVIRSRLKYTKGIVLCNQDFLTAHLDQLRHAQDGLINREADLIVVDEAHNLADKVRSATTKCINPGTLMSLIQKAGNGVGPTNRKNIYAKENAALTAVKAFFECLNVQIKRQIDDSQQDMRYAERFFFDRSAASLDLLKAMASAVQDVAFGIQIYVGCRLQLPSAFYGSLR